jgi:hypothetical protein
VLAIRNLQTTAINEAWFSSVAVGVCKSFSFIASSRFTGECILT